MRRRFKFSYNIKSAFWSNCVGLISSHYKYTCSIFNACTFWCGFRFLFIRHIWRQALGNFQLKLNVEIHNFVYRMKLQCKQNQIVFLAMNAALFTQSNYAVEVFCGCLINLKENEDIFNKINFLKIYYRFMLWTICKFFMEFGRYIFYFRWKLKLFLHSLKEKKYIYIHQIGCIQLQIHKQVYGCIRKWKIVFHSKDLLNKLCFDAVMAFFACLVYISKISKASSC